MLALPSRPLRLFAWPWRTLPHGLQACAVVVALQTVVLAQSSSPTAAIESAENVAQDSAPRRLIEDDKPLSLPQHPKRRAPKPEATTPRPAKPTRAAHRTVVTKTIRTGGHMPIPGRPARRLPSLEELKAEREASAREAAEDAAAARAKEAKRLARERRQAAEEQPPAVAEAGDESANSPADAASDDAQGPAANDDAASADEAEEKEDEAEDEEEEEGEEEEEPSEPPGLFLRLPHSFANDAITAEYIYTGESYTLAHGGMSRRQVTNYRGNLDLAITFDFDKMGLWPNARFFLYSNHVHGRPLTATDVGDFQLFSNIDSTIGTNAQGQLIRPYYTAVGEYWYEQLLLDDLVRIKIGKQDSNADFAMTDLGGDFVHSTYAMPAIIPLPTWPSQALGVSTFFTLADKLVFAAGVYDGTAVWGPQGSRAGFDTLGDNGATSLYQLEWKPQVGPNGQLPSTLRLGAWHNSNHHLWTSFTATPFEYSQNYGFWASVDQMLWKEEYGTDDEQGLGVFAQMGWAPSDRNLADQTVLAGLVYRGLIDGRDEDLFGIGVAALRFSSVFRDFARADAGDNYATRETQMEIFYKLIFSPYFSVQPDLQFIANPSGLFQDALLPGVRFELVL